MEFRGPGRKFFRQASFLMFSGIPEVPFLHGLLSQGQRAFSISFVSASFADIGSCALAREGMSTGPWRSLLQVRSSLWRNASGKGVQQCTLKIFISTMTYNALISLM